METAKNTVFRWVAPDSHYYHPLTMGEPSWKDLVGAVVFSRPVMAAAGVTLGYCWGMMGMAETISENPGQPGLPTCNTTSFEEDLVPQAGLGVGIGVTALYIAAGLAHRWWTTGASTDGEKKPLIRKAAKKVVRGAGAGVHHVVGAVKGVSTQILKIVNKETGKEEFFKATYNDQGSITDLVSLDEFTPVSEATLSRLDENADGVKRKLDFGASGSL